MSIMPEGSDFKNAIKWISDERKYNEERGFNELIQEAGMKFDLSPSDQDFLIRHIQENK